MLIPTTKLFRADGCHIVVNTCDVAKWVKDGWSVTKPETEGDKGGKGGKGEKNPPA